jgi:hypothetical protein
MIDNSLPPSRAGAERNDFDDSIDLRAVVHVLWRRKLLVMGMALCGALLGLLLATLSTRYVSEGLLLMPSVTFEQYKRYEVALANEPRLVQFLQESEQVETPAGQLLLKLIQTPGKVSEAVQPAFSHTDRDARQFGIKMENPSGFVGVRLSLSQPEKTREQPLRLLAEYARDTAIKIDLDQWVLSRCLENQTRELELRNLQLEDEFLSRQQQAKVVRLRQIIESTPGAGAIDNRQVVSLEKGSERFLSPIAQIVAAEVSIADYELAEAARERELVAAAMKKDYYCRARDLMAKPGTGRAFLLSLKALKDLALANVGSTLDVVEHTANAFDVEREKWNSAYLSQMRFVVAPEGAEVRVRKPGRIVGTLGGGVLGFMFGAVLALVLAWWRVNRAVIVADDD